jgi:pectate lyase C
MGRVLFTGIVCLLSGYVQAQSAPITGATCVSTGVVEVTKTILVASGVFDGGCKTYVPKLMDAGSQSEEIARQALLFKVENGAKLRNVIIDDGRNSTARAIEIRNGATLENVRINSAYVVDDQIYIAIKTAGAVNLDSITTIGKTGLFRTINAHGAGTVVKATNSIFTNTERVFRQTPSTTYSTTVSFERCDFNGVRDAIARTDGPGSTALVANSRLRAVKQVCRGYAPGRCTELGNVVY